MPMILGYWNIRALAQPIRLLLEYTGEKYEDKQYTFGPEKASDPREEWLADKNKLGFDFPNLPYLIDGNTKITQSNAVMRYLARKHKLCGKTEQETIRCDMAYYQASDFRMDMLKLIFNPDFESLKGDFLKAIPSKLKPLSDFLGENNWFAGNNVTFCDFLIYEIFDYYREFSPESFVGFPNLKSYMDRFEALPAISAYMKSKRFRKSPLFVKVAKWWGNE